MRMRCLIRPALMLACGMASAEIFAQACTTFDATATSTGVFSGNTCGKNLGLTTICGGTDPTNGSGTSIIQVNTGSGQPNLMFQVVSTTPGFNPELAYTIDSCSSLAACQIDDTNNTQTVGPDAPTTQPAPNSTSFVFVSDLNPEVPGCGDYNLTVNAPFNDPVLLQDFSVE